MKGDSYAITFFLCGIKTVSLLHACPLCASEQTHFYHQDKRRTYWHCNECELVFVDPTALPSLSQEKAEYDLHQNTPDDEGYRRFLNKVSNPVIQTLPAESKGLDFGCGPAPVLASMLSEAGMHMTVFDPIYHKNTDYQHNAYDFITSTEAVEHFHQPINELTLLYKLLNPGGVLVIMTKRVISQSRFASWHYKNDRTHVSFFSEATFKWIAAHFSMELTIVSDDVVFLKKLDIPRPE